MGYTKLQNSFNNYSMVWNSSRIAFYANSKQYNSISLGTWRSGGAPANPYAPFDGGCARLLRCITIAVRDKFGLDTAHVGEQAKICQEGLVGATKL